MQFADVGCSRLYLGVDAGTGSARAALFMGEDLRLAAARRNVELDQLGISGWFLRRKKFGLRSAHAVVLRKVI